MNENVLSKKSFEFAIEIVNFVKKYNRDTFDFVMLKQLIRSATAIGALVREANFAESKKDFIHKLHISLKEANETQYWLEIMKETGLIDESEFEKLNFKCIELIKILVSSIKTTKSKLQ